MLIYNQNLKKLTNMREFIHREKEIQGKVNTKIDTERDGEMMRREKRWKDKRERERRHRAKEKKQERWSFDVLTCE